MLTPTGETTSELGALFANFYFHLLSLLVDVLFCLSYLLHLYSFLILKATLGKLQAYDRYPIMHSGWNINEVHLYPKIKNMIVLNLMTNMYII